MRAILAFLGRLLAITWRLLKGLPVALIAPFALALSAIALLITDAVAAITPRPKPAPNTRPNTSAASVVIPNWNGRDLLEKYLPPLIAAMSVGSVSRPNTLGDNEIIVVDNGSSDGSAQFMRDHFPQVT